jgi:PAT family beta-lactamase induction signal transducer AmpG
MAELQTRRSSNLPRRPTLSESRFLRFLTLGALYFAQGIPWGFIGVGYVVFLTDQGLDNTAVGAALGVAYVPWSFKVVWGPLIDRFPSLRFGRRRPYIVAAQVLMGLTLLLLLAIDVTDLKLVGGVLFLHNAFAAMQDVATDALAVDVVPDEERGRANSVMWAMKSAGVALGGGGGTLFAKHFGWSALFIAIVMLLWAIMSIVLLVREWPPHGTSGVQREPVAVTRLDWHELRRSFNFRAPLVGILLSLIAPAGYGLVGGIFVRLLRADLKLSEERIAFLSGTVDPLVGVAGALLGGYLADRFGPRRVIAALLSIVALTLAAFGLTPELWGSYPFLIAWTAVNTAAINAFGAAALGFYMTLSNPAIGATQFAVFTAATNLTYAWSSPTGGYIADRFGVPAAFLAAGAVQLLSIGLLPFCDPAQARARFRSTSPV